jgi:hypothetical protein
MDITYAYMYVYMCVCVFCKFPASSGIRLNPAMTILRLFDQYFLCGDSTLT